MMEIGGMLRDTPYLDEMRRYLEHNAPPCRYRLVKIALPLAHISFAWPRLMSLYLDAKFVLVIRNWHDAYLSVCKMPHIVKGVGLKPHKPLYQMWHNGLRLQFQQHITSYPRRVVRVDYDRLVTHADKTMAPVWRTLDVDPVSDLQKMIRQPIHWQEQE